MAGNPHTEEIPVPSLASLRQSVQTRWYKRASTEILIAKIAEDKGLRDIVPLLNALRERLAYQSGALEAVDWSYANLNGALLSSCRLSHADFTGANLRGAYLGYSDMRGACLREADMREANLREAMLADADMSGANLNGANLSRADLRGARLASASLSCANLWETDLRGADLSHSLLTGCGIHGLKVDARTILPDGSACESVADLTAFAFEDAAIRHAIL